MEDQQKALLLEGNLEAPEIVHTELKEFDTTVEVETVFPQFGRPPLQDVLDGTREAVCLVNSDLEIHFANRAFAQLCDTTPQQVLGKRYCEVLFACQQPCAHCPASRTFETRRCHSVEKAHNSRVFEVTSRPIFSAEGVVESTAVYLIDITEKRNMQQWLIQSEKMATLGLLASGIAHDIRNPLNVIETARYFLQEILGDKSPEVKDKLEIISRNVKRSSRIIQNLLDFSRKSEHLREDINLSKLIEDTILLFGKELTSKNIDVSFEGQKDVRTYFSIDSLKQVLLNLIINAIQAMPQGGKLTFNIEQTVDTICLEVSDNGIGIAREHLNKIFEPLFTTKDPGVGTGLGLFISKMILERDGGQIEVQSTPNVGTTFTIVLPGGKEPKEPE